MSLPHSNTTLPEGIWYEAHRNRYRVRVRRKNRIVHQTRHPVTQQGLEEAFESLRRGRRKRVYIIKHERQIASDADGIRALAEDLV
jgi:hypothetical protein